MERSALNRTDTSIDVVSSAACALGESPLWHPVLECLLWVDIVARQLHRLDPRTGLEAWWSLPEEPGCIGLVCASLPTAAGEASVIRPPVAARDRLVITLRSGFHQLDWIGSGDDTGIALTRLSPALFDTATQRFNDGKVDPAGRFWAGSLFEPKTSARAGLYCLDHGRATAVTGDGAAGPPWCEWGVTTSNGLAFSPDASVMYQSDTPAHVVHAFDFDVATGTVRNRRPWWRTDGDKSAPDYAGRPDGAAVDVDGCYWTAMYEGGRVAQISPDGVLLRTIPVPARCPTMVAFGGDDLRTLYVTSARHGRAADELARWPFSGHIFAVRVTAAGLPPNLYRPLAE